MRKLNSSNRTKCPVPATRRASKRSQGTQFTAANRKRGTNPFTHLWLQRRSGTMCMQPRPLNFSRLSGRRGTAELMQDTQMSTNSIRQETTMKALFPS